MTSYPQTNCTVSPDPRDTRAATQGWLPRALSSPPTMARASDPESDQVKIIWKTNFWQSNHMFYVVKPCVSPGNRIISSLFRVMGPLIVKETSPHLGALLGGGCVDVVVVVTFAVCSNLQHTPIFLVFDSRQIVGKYLQNICLISK